MNAKKIFDLTGKSAMITGGASGIGKSISKLFAESGAKVHIIDMDKELAEKTVEEIKAEGHEALFHQCDVTDQKQVMALFDTLFENSGLDILINNAGIAHIGTAETTTEDDLDRVYNVNVKGVYNCIKAAIAPMKSKGGAIINMASIASVVGLNDRFAYSMSKGAVYTMTLSVAKDFIKHNIRCNCIAPARIHTPFVDGFLAKNYPGKEEEMFEKLSQTQPIGRMGTPDEVAALALYLCSDEAAFITGTCYPIDGGFVTLNS